MTSDMLHCLLNINFQFGDFFGQEQSGFISALWDCIPAFIGSIIAVFGSLCIFNRQITASKKIDKEKSDLVAAKNCHYFAYVILETIKLSKEQSNAIDKSIKNYENNIEEQLLRLKRYSFGFINNFTQSNNLETIFNAYTNHIGSEDIDIEHFNNIIKSVFTLKELNDIIIEGHNEAIQYDFNRRVKYDNYYKKLMPILIHYSDSIRKNHELEKISNEKIKPILEDFLRETTTDPKKQNLKFIHKKLITPTIEIVEKNQLYKEPNSTEMIELLINLNYLYYEIIDKNKFHLENLKEDSKLMYEISKGLKKNSTKLRVKFNYQID